MPHIFSFFLKSPFGLHHVASCCFYQKNCAWELPIFNLTHLHNTKIKGLVYIPAGLQMHSPSRTPSLPPPPPKKCSFCNRRLPSVIIFSTCTGFLVGRHRGSEDKQVVFANPVLTSLNQLCITTRWSTQSRGHPCLPRSSLLNTQSNLKDKPTTWTII